MEENPEKTPAHIKKVGMEKKKREEWGWRSEARTGANGGKVSKIGNRRNWRCRRLLYLGDRTDGFKIRRVKGPRGTDQSTVSILEIRRARKVSIREVWQDS